MNNNKNINKASNKENKASSSSFSSRHVGIGAPGGGSGKKQVDGNIFGFCKVLLQNVAHFGRLHVISLDEV